MKNIVTLLLLCVSFVTQAQYKKYIVVSQNGSGDFTTIQEAVNSVRDFTLFPVTIFIKKGIYHEKLTIPSWKTSITLQGEDEDSTIITNGDYYNKPFPGKDLTSRTVFGTFNSYTVLIAGDDMTLQNLTIINSSGPVGQAVALHVEGDRCRILHCKLLGNQDTLYTGTAHSRQYYNHCYIAGTTDFIFGAATVLFDSCTIHSLRDSYITAASTTSQQQYGFVFLHCNLTADSGVTKVYLGRPWRPYASTAFLYCTLGQHILPAGWHNWDNTDNEKTARYSEYHNTGTTTESRVPWSHQLTAKQATHYTWAGIFGDWKL
jgi:pectinesterase